MFRYQILNEVVEKMPASTEKMYLSFIFLLVQSIIDSSTSEEEEERINDLSLIVRGSKI